MIWDRSKINTTLRILTDDYLEDLQQQWANSHHQLTTAQELAPKLNAWFQSSRYNNLVGWQDLGCVDVTMGNTHYIESLILRLGWNGFQILNNEYAYYSFMGKWGVEVDALEPNKPLLITLPHFKWGGMRPEWPNILQACVAKNIDIHIDMAWVTLARNIEIDFSHPCIKSVGMSMSKYNLQWNRVGLRYSKQRTMDSITMFNHYYQNSNNANLLTCADFMIDRIPRDYGWQTYQTTHQEICQQLNLQSTDLVHVAIDPTTIEQLGITPLLRLRCPHTKN